MQTKERQEKMAKDIFSKIIKNYNNELETVLEKKDFSEDVKNLLLSMLYKIENSYEDYKKVKVNIVDKKQFAEEIIETIEKRCNKIEIIKPMTEQGQELYEQNRNCIVDKENGIIQTFQNEKSILEAIIEMRQEKIELNAKYNLFKKPIFNILYIGNKMNSLELIKDFNGWSWDISKLEENVSNYSKMYQMLILLLGNREIDSWVNNRAIEEIEEVPNNVILSSKYNESFGITKEEMQREKKDNIEEILNKFEKKYNEKLTKKFFTVFMQAAILECCMYDEKYKSEIQKSIDNTNDELTKMRDNRLFIEELSKQKKQINIRIKEIDTLVSDEKLLKEEYKRKNENVPNKEKIFSVSHLKLMYEKERERKLEEIKKINKSMEPKEFVRIKKKMEETEKFYSDIHIEEGSKENVIRIQKKLEKVFIECFKKKIEDAQEKKKIENLIYELRYYKLMPNIIIKELNDIEKKLINKACEQKVLVKFSEDENMNYRILNELFNTRIIDLDTIVISLKYLKGILTLNIYDANTHDETKEIEITEKTELIVKLNKKIKIWQ